MIDESSPRTEEGVDMIIVNRDALNRWAHWAGGSNNTPHVVKGWTMPRRPWSGAMSGVTWFEIMEVIRDHEQRMNFNWSDPVLGRGVCRAPTLSLIRPL